MAKHYLRGKFKNNYSPIYRWPTIKSYKVGGSKIKRTNFVKTLIARGIGYRMFAVANDSTAGKQLNKLFIKTNRLVSDNVKTNDEIVQSTNFEFPYANYVTVRAGHNKDMLLPVYPSVSTLTSKKDRKLVLAGEIHQVSGAAKQLWSYRPPSVYTGRGIRLKHVRPIRKAGKKDKQKGKAF